LDSLPEIITATFPLDDMLVDLTRRDVVLARQGDVEVSLVIAQVEINLSAVVEDKALAVPGCRGWSAYARRSWNRDSTTHQERQTRGVNKIRLHNLRPNGGLSPRTTMQVPGGHKKKEKKKKHRRTHSVGAMVPASTFMYGSILILET